VKATEVTAGLAGSNGSLVPGLWRDSIHVTCGLTACTPGSAPGPTLGNECEKNFAFFAYTQSDLPGVSPDWGGAESDIYDLVAAVVGESMLVDMADSDSHSDDHAEPVSSCSDDDRSVQPPASHSPPAASVLLTGELSAQQSFSDARERSAIVIHWAALFRLNFSFTIFTSIDCR